MILPGTEEALARIVSYADPAPPTNHVGPTPDTSPAPALSCGPTWPAPPNLSDARVRDVYTNEATLAL